MLLVARLAGLAAVVGWAVFAVLMTAAVAFHSAQRYDRRWLLRQLDAASAALEDSSALALAPDQALSPLQQLQQARVQQRLSAQLADREWNSGLRPPLPWRRLRIAVLVGLLLVLIAFLLPQLRAVWTTHAAASVAESAGGLTKIEAALSVTPPAYTGLGVQKVSALDVKAPVDSRIAWALSTDHEATAVALLFQDGLRLELQRDGRVWRGERMLTASTLYRVEIQGAAPAADKASRLDAIPDAPPEVVVRQPEKTLNLLTPDQKTWPLAFEARDDYGLGEATLTVTLAQGSGDNIKTTEQKLVLEGRGDARSRHYEKTLDLAALGYAKGDDLIVRLSVADNHVPQPNISSSASFILRWPPEKSSESEGMEGLVQKTLPAYFRSERQIIIDTEALIAKRAGLEVKSFEKQADELGVDQKVLRLRYGQVLGEGFETTADKAPQAEHADGDKPQPGASEALKHLPDDGDHAVTDAPVIGRDEDVLHEFGHAHDNAEATTLLDPETRRILKAALDEMWQAELNLRQAKPEAALPFEYKALDYIKQVQQAERIYLARAGLELPQVDSARRLSGKRDGLSDRAQTLPPPEVIDSPIPAAWEALARGDAIDAAAVGTWLRSHPDAVTDALGLLAALDRVQHEPDCADCRSELKGRLWPLLPLPPTAVRPRTAPDAAGAAYLDALSGTAQPEARP
jgi:hypothetical protein